MAQILIVDDSGMSRRTLRKILEAEGHVIAEAEEGMVALERYFIDRPDLVFLDLTMTGMYGIEVLKKLREIDPQARVIVASADTQASTLQMVEEGGASGFVSKPFTSEKVLATLHGVLKGGKDAVD